MKIKEDFMLHTVAESYIVVPVGKATTLLNGIITLNESGVFLWKLLDEGADRNQLIDRLASEYELSIEKAAKDTDAFLDTLREIGCLEE